MEDDIMLEEAFVSCDIAKRLKEKGFDGHLYWFYYEDDEKRIFHAPYTKSNKEREKKIIICPTQQMAMRWLREKKGIHIAVNLTKDGRNFETDIFKNGKFFSPAFEEMEFETYELAVAFGLLFVLTKMEL